MGNKTDRIRARWRTAQSKARTTKNPIRKAFYKSLAAARLRLLKHSKHQDKTRRPAKSRELSIHGLNFIKEFEGLSLKAYDDGTGVWTIGYGHIEGVRAGDKLKSKAAADELLASDLRKRYEPAVRALPIGLTQNEYDALVSLVYNLGTGIISTEYQIGRNLRIGHYRAAASNILLYDHAGNKRLPGLTRRREAERKLFLKR